MSAENAVRRRHRNMSRNVARRRISNGKIAGVSLSLMKVGVAGCRRMTGALCVSKSTGPAAIYIRNAVEIENREKSDTPAWLAQRTEPVMKIAGFFCALLFSRRRIGNALYRVNAVPAISFDEQIKKRDLNPL